MSKRMLVDASHPEETRVVVASGNHLEDYDVETTLKKQIKANIYLAKVVRIEPSLQAAFIDYGGERHGFLSFNDIHPDYYQIPAEDRRKLLEEQEALEEDPRAADELLEEIDVGLADEDDEGEAKGGAMAGPPSGGGAEDGGRSGESEEAGGEEEAAAKEAPPARRGRRPRRYKIQEVIKPRQILLVQVVKEERGNKGAALTTYISLAGRCCVLMPNTTRGGGISRKITNAKERRKLRDTLDSLDVPEGVGIIIRTAGRERSRAEIRRDFEYLLRAWDQVRRLTLESTAPCLVYEEGDVIKRAIRDVYNRDIEEILIEGHETYQSAKKFMRLMMPSHAKRVQPYRDEAQPLFHRYRIEQQLEAIHMPEVALKSGGRLVLDATEALVAIDVNSGRSTRGRSIEETALKTNLEAADEIARQLRLRDLAGLIVIDFIDMDDDRNVRKVERRVREAMKNDRARLQIGRISEFGLMEMSRQRLRPSLIETSSRTCPHCRGTGHVLSTETMALRLLRAVEEEGGREGGREVTLRVPTEVALYALNHKRGALAETESRLGLKVTISGDDSVVPPEIVVDRAKDKRAAERPSRRGRKEAASGPVEAGAASGGQDAAGDAKPGRRRRGRRRKAPESAEAESAAVESAAEPEATGEADVGEQDGGEAENDAQGQRRRRRSRRGGRRRRSSDAGSEAAASGGAEAAGQAGAAPDGSGEDVGSPDGSGSAAEPEDARPSPGAAPAGSAPSGNGAGGDAAAAGAPVMEAPDMAPRAGKKPKRRGWWQGIMGG